MTDRLPVSVQTAQPVPSGGRRSRAGIKVIHFIQNATFVTPKLRQYYFPFSFFFFLEKRGSIQKDKGQYER